MQAGIGDLTQLHRSRHHSATAGETRQRRERGIFAISWSMCSQRAEIADFGAALVSRAAALMHRCADLPMDFADPTLLPEQLTTTTVFTLDGRGFGVYRVGRRAFRLVPEGLAQRNRRMCISDVHLN